MTKEIAIKFQDKEYLLKISAEIHIIFEEEKLLIKTDVFDVSQELPIKRNILNVIKRVKNKTFKKVQTIIHNDVIFVKGHFYFNEELIIKEVLETLEKTIALTLIN